MPEHFTERVPAGHLVGYHVAALLGEEVAGLFFVLAVDVGALDEEVGWRNFALSCGLPIFGESVFLNNIAVVLNVTQ